MKFLKAISVEELKDILDNIPPLTMEGELITLEKGFNRVISRDTESHINVPHFRKSRMDGYAVIAEDTFSADEDNLITLKLIEHIPAGDAPQKTINKGYCSYVATGAAIPEGADAVVMVEFSEVVGDEVSISKGVTPGTHVINIGHDVKQGDIVCKKDTLIDLPTIGILSACGLSEVWVYKKPIVCLMSTGNELMPPNSKNLEIGKIYDVNSNVLKNAIHNSGAEVNYLGIIKDNFEELRNAIKEGVKTSDILILSGGTSKGEGDFGPKVVEEFDNIEIMIHGVRIKPGKPFIFAKFENHLIFILPGYPTSALSCFYVFIEDFIRKVAGYPLREKNSSILESGERIYSTVGRHEFKPVKIYLIDGVKMIFPIKTGSEAISTLFYADGYIEIEELESIIDKGDKRRVYFFQ